MYQKFNTNTMLTKFIKQILKDTYIPKVHIWHNGDSVTKEFAYIVNGYVAVAKQDWESGLINNPYDLFDFIHPYVKGKFYPGITTNYESNSSIYDAETHKALGNYLRYIRDIDNIDLMPYYNCWDGTFTDRLRIKGNSVNTQPAATDDGLTTLIIPIKFGAEYTLYINSKSTISLTRAFIKEGRVIDTDNPIFDVSTANTVSYASPLKFTSAPYDGEAVVYGKIGNNGLEDYLCLLVQLPASDSTNVIVLEGDYTQSYFFNIVDNEGFITEANQIQQIHYGVYTEDGDKIFPSKELQQQIYRTSIPSLSRNISTSTYAFSDRLIEYLVNNVITSDDHLPGNIRRVQRDISSARMQQLTGTRYNLEQNSTKGVWDENMRLFIYNLVTQASPTPSRVDINGFIDKDSEAIIIGGRVDV